MADAAYQAIVTVSDGTRSNTGFNVTGLGTISANDLLIILVWTGSSSGTAVTAPSGFSAISSSPLLQISKSDPWTSRVYAFYKVATGSESGTISTTHSSCSSAGCIMRWNNTATSSIFSPTPTTNNGTGSTTTATGLTADAGSGIIFASVTWDGQGGAAPTGSTPTFTERFDTGASGMAYVATGSYTAGGATGNKTNSNANSFGNPFAATLIAIEPLTVSQDTPELYGRPAGSHGQSQMNQLLAM